MEGRDPPVNAITKKPPLSKGDKNGGRDDWGNDESFRSNDKRRNQSESDFRQEPWSSLQSYVTCSLAQVKEGGLDNTVSETVNVVASKTTEIGQRTWGIMKGVMAIASQKVEEFTKEEASNWNQQNKSGFYDDKAATNSSSSYQSNYRNSSSCDDWGEESNSKKEAAPKVSQSVHHNGYGNSNSWDDWGEEKNSTTKKEAAPKVSASKDDDAGWAGWDDKEDDGYYQSAAGDKKSVGHNGKPPEPA